jgi:branched-chain amino acid aminotransferase
MEAKTNYSFFEDRFVPIEQANVNILNQTFMYGLGVFEGIRGYWNAQHKQVYLFRLREHIERLFDSMKVMHLSCKYSVEEVCDIIVKLVQKNAPSTDIYVRPAVYSATNQISPCLTHSTSALCILTLPFGDYVDTKGGLKVQVSAWRRVEDNAIPARAKIIGSYVNAALAKTDAALAGMDECIMLSENGHVAEGSSMNLFMVKKGVLITTPTTENILEGITRSTILEMAEKEFGLPTASRPIDRSELYTADELFFCGTGAQVAPIASVDGRQIGTTAPGPISCQIRDTYIDICRGNRSEYSKWLTPALANANAALPMSAPTQRIA